MPLSTHITASTQQASSQLWEQSRWFRIVLITAFGLGLVFRFAGLGNKIYSHDETYASLRAAGFQKFDVLKSIRDGDDHTAQEIFKFMKPGEDKTITDTLFITAQSGPHQAPLFYLLAHYWMRIVGFTPMAMRALAALIGTLSIPAMYWFSRELFHSTRISLLSTALFALSPFHILFAQDARPYSLWTLSTLVSSAALLWAIKKNTISAWWLYASSIILGMYSHQLFSLVAVVHTCFFAIRFFIQRKRDYAGFLSAGLLAFLAYTPWLYMVITYWDRAVESMGWVTRQVSWSQYLRSWALIFSSPFLDLDFASGNLIPYLLRALVMVLIALSSLALLQHGPTQCKVFLLLMLIIPAGAFIVPDLLLGGVRSIGGRYFVPFNIAIVQIVAYWIAHQLDHADRTAFSKWVSLLGIVMAASISSNVNSFQADTWWNKELSRVTPQFLCEINQDQALLFVSTGQHGSTVGEVLQLGIGVDADVHFILPADSGGIEYTSDYEHVYWLANSSQEVQEISEKNGLRIREVLQNTLWKIDGRMDGSSEPVLRVAPLPSIQSPSR
jgi:uncharacterized membrane protein